MSHPRSQTRIVIGSRESTLAQIQARMIITLLERQAFSNHPEILLKTFKTQGDIRLDQKLSDIGEKGLFVKELETALLAGEIDIAVHSMKDMPGEIPQRLALQSASPREDPRDVLITNDPACTLASLKPGSIIGTSSVRRIAQFKRLRPDLVFRDIRGNLETRLRKLEEGLYDALILAAAGCHRGGYAARIAQYFDPVYEVVPAACQGILAVEYRENDGFIRNVLRQIADPETELRMKAERSLLRELQAGCSIPFGVYAYADPSASAGGRYAVKAVLFSESSDLGSEGGFREAEGRFETEADIPAMAGKMAERLCSPSCF